MAARRIAENDAKAACLVGLLLLGQTRYQPRFPLCFLGVLGAGMSLDKDTVARIARLARLKVPEEELAPLAGELSRHLCVDRAAERGRHQ